MPLALWCSLNRYKPKQIADCCMLVIEVRDTRSAKKARQSDIIHAVFSAKYIFHQTIIHAVIQLGKDRCSHVDKLFVCTIATSVGKLSS